MGVADSDNEKRELHVAEELSRDRKQLHLTSMSEDDFRDQVVRVICERQGLAFVRDMCGPDELGKDCIFEAQDPLGRTVVYAVQTKKGDLKMSSNARTNVANAIAQLRTALDAQIDLTNPRRRVKPDYVILCASGRVNEKAKRHINDELKDNRIGFEDANDLIPKIDKLYPEFWYGIDATKFPYFKRLRQALLNMSDTIIPSDVNSEERVYSPVSDDTYMKLFVHRITTTSRRRRGEVHIEPKFDQIPIQKIIDRDETLLWITGEGGAGKTTALRRIAYVTAGANLENTTAELIPVLVRAVDLRQGDVTMLEAIESGVERLTAIQTPVFEVNDLQAGRVLILVDALDEITNHQERDYVVGKIKEFHAKYPTCKTILTSRDYSSITKLVSMKTFERYHISEFDMREVEKTIDHLASRRRVPKQQAKETLRQLQDVHGVDLNPLIVTLFIGSADFHKRDIPPNITEIFKKFTEQMLGRWDERKGLSQQYEAPLKDLALPASVWVELAKAGAPPRAPASGGPQKGFWQGTKSAFLPMWQPQLLAVRSGPDRETIVARLYPHECLKR